MKHFFLDAGIYINLKLPKFNEVVAP